jgi:hypothetical protein
MLCLDLTNKIPAPVPITGAGILFVKFMNLTDLDLQKIRLNNCFQI